MSLFSITDYRINGDKFYLVEKESKVCMYTRNISAARSWIKSQIDASNILNSHEIKDEAAITLDGSNTKNVFDSNSDKLRDIKIDFENAQPEFQGDTQGSNSSFMKISKPIRIS